MIGALALVLALAPVNKGAVQASVQAVLESPDFRFCHDGEYPLRLTEKPWCPIVGESSASCPLLPAACKAGTTESESRPRDGRGVVGHKPGQVVDEDEGPPRQIRLPNLGGLGRLLLWAMILAGVVVVGYTIAKAAMNRRRDEDEPPVEEPPEIGETPEAAARRAIETDVDRLLARARLHAAAGRYDAGIDDAWAALLRRLEGGELIRVHPSRTNGDYVRDLAPMPELRSKVRTIARDVERVQFGTEPPSAETFHAVMNQVVPIATRAIRAAVFLLASSLFFACGAGSGARSHGAWDTSPSGTRAVFEVLRKAGFEPRWRVKPLGKLGDVMPAKLESGGGIGPSGPDVLVLLPGTVVSDSDWAAVKAYAGRGGTIIATADLPNLAEIGIKPREMNANADLRIAPALEHDFGALRVVTPGTRVLEVDIGEPDPILHRGADLYAAEVTVPGGVVVAIGDGYLLTNAALAAGDNAMFLVTLLARHGSRIEFTGDFTGSSPVNPIEAIERGKLAWVLLQLLVFIAALFLFRGVAFGKLRDLRSDSRRRFVEHARALGVQYARAGATRFTAAAYASYALDRLRERIHLGTRRGLSPLADAIATRTGRASGEVMRVLVEAQSAREAALDRDTPEDDLALIRELSRLLKSTGGSR